MYYNLRPFNSFPKTMTFFDLETTGLDINESRIIQFASKTFNNEADETFPSNVLSENGVDFDERVNVLNHILNPQIHVSKEILDLTGISREEIKEGKYLKDIADDIHTTFLNTQLVISYNGLNYDLPLLQNELMRVMKPFNYKTSRHFNNDCVMFIDLRQVVYNEIRADVFQWCEEKGLPKNLKLSTVYKFITSGYSDSLGLSDDIEEKDTKFHDGLVDVNCSIRVFIGLMEKYNVDMLSYVTSYMNLPNYSLSLEVDGGTIITKRGKYSDRTLKELVDSNEPKAKKWLLLQNQYNNLTLSSELVKSLTTV
jgi:DNA polymerase III epsilon subunit-like protein